MEVKSLISSPLLKGQREFFLIEEGRLTYVGPVKGLEAKYGNDKVKAFSCNFQTGMCKIVLLEKKQLKPVDKKCQMI